MKTIIVGGIDGGAACATRLRRFDEKAEILLLERRPYFAYANSGLPYHMEGITENESSPLYAKEQIFKSMFAIDCRTSCEVIGISTRNKTIQIQNLKTDEITVEQYDKLVISPSAAPILPNIPGLNFPEYFPLEPFLMQ